MKRFNIEKAKAVVLYISNSIGQTDFLKIFKILYFAEQKHISKYGDMILDDSYLAMKHGPVPSLIYELFKGLRGDAIIHDEYAEFYKAFKVINRYNVESNEEPNLDYLSKSNIACIDESIKENSSLSFNTLSKKSHDSAWKSANPDDSMDLIEIAKAGGANEEMTLYIQELLENKNFALC